LCSSRKYPYLPQGREVPPPLWKLRLSFVHFFKLFGLAVPPTRQEIPIPSVGGIWSMDIFWDGTLQFN